MPLADALDQHLSRLAAAPVLFVGSGLSRRYLGLESWRALLERFAAPLPQPFQYYFSTADGDLPRTASLMADAFHEIWWTSDQFKEQRSLHAEEGSTRQSALKSAISDYVLMQSDRSPDNDLLKQELSIFGQAVIDGIITTNWDLLIERLFPEYRVFVGQEDVLFGNPQGIGEIYKIHGTCIEPNTLVLTTEDYSQFDDRNPYLAAKLLATFVEHPVLFLGYSISDPNVLSLLSAIARCLTRSNVRQLQDRLIFVEYSPDSARETLDAVPLVTGGLTLPATSVRVGDFLGVFEGLTRVRRKFPARLLRQLKEHVYELVKSNDPHDRLFVQDIDSDTDLTSIDVVFGVGAMAKPSPAREEGAAVAAPSGNAAAAGSPMVALVGYRGIKRLDLADDVLSGGSRFDAREIVTRTLPELLRGATYVPVYKYLREGGYLDADGGLVTRELPGAVIGVVEAGIGPLQRTPAYEHRREWMAGTGLNLSDLVEMYEAGYVLYRTPLLPLDRIDPAVLRDFLLHQAHFRENSGQQSHYLKLVCLYDYLTYRKPR